MPIANVICADNGVGLSQDREIIRALLVQNGFTVVFNSGEATDLRQRYDLNIYCEQFFRSWLPLARKNIIIPNPEWFFEGWTKYLYRFDKIFCKTKDCQVIFSKLSPKTVFTSFTSADKFLPKVERKNIFSHFAGKSSHKGTRAIVVAAHATKMPEINIYTQNGQINYPINNSKIVLHMQRITDERFNYLQNESQFHLCPSEYEGWGHYINEAKSVGAIIVTTNAAPMNELVTGDFGFGASYESVGTHHLAPLYKVSPQSIAECINIAAAMDSDLIKELSKRSRASYLANDKFFKERFMNEILDLLK